MGILFAAKQLPGVFDSAIQKVLGTQKQKLWLLTEN